MSSLLFQILFSWSVKPATEGELRRADVIIALSFGLRKDSAGTSNEALARIVGELHTKYGIPVIAQHEIADCLVEPPLATIREHRKSGEYLDTFEVVDQSNIVCAKHAFTNPVIVAHRAHQWRVIEVVKRFGILPIAADVSSVPYDRQSAQRWTKNKIFFRIYDTIARFHYWREGYIS